MDTNSDKLSTDPYKGVRDFYPDEMAVESYIFDIWRRTVESFGYERYDASILEPAELYSAKTSEEIVNEQTYTFKDRGDRLVTLRPEMTPTTARMIAKKRRELSFPVRWYSIPNLFRYERMQRGRLREHWQLNCDIFGSTDIAADIEVITLAHQILLNFGADPSMFEIRINDRQLLNQKFDDEGLSESQKKAMFALLDRKEKVDNFDEEAEKITGRPYTFSLEPDTNGAAQAVLNGLETLGINNALFSPSTVRGLTYYTGVVFEFFDTAKKNSRSLLGGGRYNNLTGLFGGEPVPGVGFGMGDVTMRDFLETHNLLTANITAPTLMIIPTDPTQNIKSEKIAAKFRRVGISVAVNIGTRKLAKKIGAASEKMVSYIVVVGEDETTKNEYALKNLADGTEVSGTIEELIKRLTP